MGNNVRVAQQRGMQRLIGLFIGGEKYHDQKANAANSGWKR